MSIQHTCIFGLKEDKSILLISQSTTMISSSGSVDRASTSGSGRLWVSSPAGSYLKSS